MEKIQQLFSENGEKCTQGIDSKHTYRCIKKPHVQVTIPNDIPTKSQRSRLILVDTEILSCYWKPTSESILTNRYGTRRSRNGLVFEQATTYKRGMTETETNLTPTASNHRTGSATRKHLGVYLLAENRSWRLVNECTLEEIATRVNKHLKKSQPDETTSELRDRRCGYPDK